MDMKNCYRTSQAFCLYEKTYVLFENVTRDTQYSSVFKSPKVPPPCTMTPGHTIYKNSSIPGVRWSFIRLLPLN